MGRLALASDQIHFADGSHRWYAPLDVDQASWEETVRAHIATALLEGGCHEAQRKVGNAVRGARTPVLRRVS
jgi:hypothetical protein